ncbi:unnamed protein product, partial [Meganyctiphanes norvegica]
MIEVSVVMNSFSIPSSGMRLNNPLSRHKKSTKRVPSYYHPTISGYCGTTQHVDKGVWQSFRHTSSRPHLADPSNTIRNFVVLLSAGQQNTFQHFLSIRHCRRIFGLRYHLFADIHVFPCISRCSSMIGVILYEWITFGLRCFGTRPEKHSVFHMMFSCKMLTKHFRRTKSTCIIGLTCSSICLHFGGEESPLVLALDFNSLQSHDLCCLPQRPPVCWCNKLAGCWDKVPVGTELLEANCSIECGVNESGEDAGVFNNASRLSSSSDLSRSALRWRRRSPTKRHLELMVDELNAGRPQCPVGLNTLVIPRKATLTASDKQPLVYLICGHVQGTHDWGHEKDSNHHTCPMCLKVGPVVKLCMGIEPAFYVDSGPPSYCFNPCGHMASEKTVKYWAAVPIPHGTNGFHAACPFCASPLEGDPGFLKLIFQDNCD